MPEWVLNVLVIFGITLSICLPFLFPSFCISRYRNKNPLTIVLAILKVAEAKYEIKSSGAKFEREHQAPIVIIHTGVCCIATQILVWVVP
jgi:hypothetical protein